MTYSIGDLERPKRTDRRFEDVEEAEIAAIEASIDDGIWAVWDDNDRQVLAIVYQQDIYHP